MTKVPLQTVFPPYASSPPEFPRLPLFFHFFIEINGKNILRVSSEDKIESSAEVNDHHCKHVTEEYVLFRQKKTIFLHEK